MPQLVIKAGRPSEVTSPERRAVLRALRSSLAAGGADVDLEITDYISGRRGLSWSETVEIFIGASVGGTVLTAVTNDIYHQVKLWALERYRQKRRRGTGANPRPEQFTIYGPDGEVLKRWKVDTDGEHDEGGE